MAGVWTEPVVEIRGVDVVRGQAHLLRAVDWTVRPDERWVLMHEMRGAPEPDLEAQLAILSPCDLVLVEGFKDVPIPKIEIHRPAHGKALLYPDNPAIVAIATDADLSAPLPCLNLNDPAAVAAFILTHQGLS